MILLTLNLFGNNCQSATEQLRRLIVEEINRGDYEFLLFISRGEFIGLRLILRVRGS